jgi:hypothetical protein
VREEVLYREALALGLDRNDFVIRQRLIQKLEFINRDLTEEMTELTDEEIRRYFAAHRDRYIQPARITFTQVFFSTGDGGPAAGGPGETTAEAERAARRDAVVARAERTLAALNSRQVDADDAGRYGDEFVDGAQFVERSPEELVRIFGQELTDTLFALEAEPARWQGPLESSQGLHLVSITALTPERMLELAEAEKAVREDARRDRIEERNRAILQEIVDAYDVQITFRPRSPAGPEETSGTRP